MDKQKPEHPTRRWARLRFAIVGGLLASPPPEGALGLAIAELAARTWNHPLDDRPITFGQSTIERWYYLALNASDPLAVLTHKVRSDSGRRKAISPALFLALQQQYQDHPNWSFALHADNIRTLAFRDPERYGKAPSYTSIRRRMLELGWRRRRLPRHPTPGQIKAAERLEKFEVRSYESPFVHALWHLDFHEARRRVVDSRGSWHTPVLLGILDDCCRLGCHVQWYLAETAENLAHGLHQAFAKRGLPRGLMTDRGSAMIAAETQEGLVGVGVIPQLTLANSPYQNGKQECFWSQVEGRLMAMIENVEPLTLDFLNRATQAWVELEYNRKHHDELGKSPLERFLEGPDVSRRAPSAEILRQKFTLEETRTQRRSDGTVSIEGIRFEIPSAFRTLRRVSIRYRRWDLSEAWLMDGRTDTVIAVLRPQDKARNADGHRRLLEPIGVEPTRSSRSREPLPPLMQKILADYAATGLPPAYLPKDEIDPEDNPMNPGNADV